MSTLEEQLAAKEAEIAQLRAEVCLAKSMHKVAIEKLSQAEELIADLPDAVHMENGMAVVRPEKLSKLLAAIATMATKS